MLEKHGYRMPRIGQPGRLDQHDQYLLHLCRKEEDGRTMIMTLGGCTEGTQIAILQDMVRQNPAMMMMLMVKGAIESL